jgi:hypothetical protein
MILQVKDQLLSIYIYNYQCIFSSHLKMKYATEKKKKICIRTYVRTNLPI